MKTAFSIALLFVFNQSFSQVKYSKADLAQIRKIRGQEKSAYKNWDRQLHYEVGAFFDKIYHKYRDTSMSAAIRNYTRSTESEGDLMDEGSILAAYRLGEIYSSGTGADTNFAKAMFYFLLSGDRGTASLEKLKKTVCRQPRILFATPDSVVIAFSPYCIADPKTFSFLRPMIEKIQGDFEKAVDVRIFYPEGDIHTSYYRYYHQEVAPRRIRSVIASYLDPFISTDRLSTNILSGPHEGSEYLMIFTVVKFPG